MGKNNGRPNFIERGFRWIGDKGNKYVFPLFLRLAGTFGFLFNWNQGFAKILPKIFTTDGLLSIFVQTIAFSVPPLLLASVRQLSVKRRKQIENKVENNDNLQKLAKKYHNSQAHICDVLGAIDTSYQYLGLFMLAFTFADVYDGRLNPGYIADEMLWNIYVALTVFAFVFGCVLGYASNRQESDEKLRGFMLVVKKSNHHDGSLFKEGGEEKGADSGEEYTIERARGEFQSLKNVPERKPLLM